MTEFTLFKIVSKALNKESIQSKKLYELHLQSEDETKAVKELKIIYRQQDILLSPWKNKMVVKLTGQQILDILNQDAYLSLEFEDDYRLNLDAIKNQSKRLIKKDAHTTEISYIARNDIQKRIIANQYQKLTFKLLAFENNDHEVKEWYFEDNDNLFLIEDSLFNIHQQYLKNFHHKKLVFHRVHEIVQQDFELKKNKETLILFNVSAIQRFAQFTEYEQRKNYGSPRHGGDSCKETHRRINGHTEQNISPQQIWRFLGIHKMTDLLDYNDHSFAFRNDSDSVTVQKDLLESFSKIAVGRIKSSCDYPFEGQMLSPEAELKLSIDAYVEKL